MSRLTAWIVLVASAALIYALAFTSYDHFSGTWESTDSGGLVKVTVECPPPFQVLVFGAEPAGLEQPGFCVRSSRTLAFEAAIVAIVAVLLAWKPVTRARPTPIGRISDRIDFTPDSSG